MEGILEIVQFLQSPKDVVIFSHRNPDGDAMGSSLALKLFLENTGHTVSVIYPSEYPATLCFLPKSDDAIIFDFETEKSIEKIKNAKLMFFLDFSGLDRIDKMGEFVVDHPAMKIHIDHHLDPEPFADFVLSDSTASSTSELVFRFFELLGVHNRLNHEIATCLLTGIITDTGSFKYNVTSTTFKIAGELMKYEPDLNDLQDKIYNRQSEKYIRLLGHCLANRMEIIPEYKTGIIKLTKEDYKTYDIQRGDTEGIVNYLMMINSVEVAALITEQPTIIKLSLRSKADISVQKIARDHFKGGGHKNASGGAAYGNLEAVIKKFKSILPNYIK
jgi:phosphoesterase RecJ-like protein